MPPSRQVIDAAEAAGGGTVFLPAGTYLLGSVTTGAVCLRVDSDNVRIVGASRGATTLLLDAAMDAHVINFDSVANCSMQHLTINGDRANQTANAHGIRMAGTTDCLVHDVTITECSGYGIGMQAGTFDRNHFRDLTITNTGADGIDVKNLDNANGINFIDGLTVSAFGLDGSLTDQQAGIDLRGPWKVTDVVVRGFASGSGLIGIRLRNGETTDPNGLGAHETILSGFVVKAASQTATVGLHLAARSCSVTDGRIEMCGRGMEIFQTENRLSNILVTGYGEVGLLCADTGLPSPGSRTVVTNLSFRSGASGSIAVDLQTRENQIVNLWARSVHDFIKMSGDENKLVLAIASQVTGTFMTNTGSSNELNFSPA